MATEERARPRVRVWSRHWHCAYDFQIEGEYAYPDLCPSIPYPLVHLRAIASRWEDLPPGPPALPDITDRAYCAWCDNRSLSEPVEALEQRTGRAGSTVWLCNIHADALVDALDSMVRQHCYRHFDKLAGEYSYDSGALRANCEAFDVLIKNKSAELLGDPVGRRVFVKLNE